MFIEPRMNAKSEIVRLIKCGLVQVPLWLDFVFKRKNKKGRFFPACECRTIDRSAYKSDVLPLRLRRMDGDKSNSAHTSNCIHEPINIIYFIHTEIYRQIKD